MPGEPSTAALRSPLLDERVSSGSGAETATQSSSVSRTQLVGTRKPTSRSTSWSLSSTLREPAFLNAVSGACAGALGAAVTTPLEVLKTRLQVQTRRKYRTILGTYDLSLYIYLSTCVLLLSVSSSYFILNTDSFGMLLCVCVRARTLYR